MQNTEHGSSLWFWLKSDRVNFGLFWSNKKLHKYLMGRNKVKIHATIRSMIMFCLFGQKQTK